MIIPDRASTLQNLAHHNLVSCYFVFLGTRKQSSHQESRGSVDLSADITDMRFPFQIISDFIPKYLMLSTFSRTVPSNQNQNSLLVKRQNDDTSLGLGRGRLASKCIRSLDFIMIFRQLHHVAFDMLESHTLFPSPTA